MDRTWTFGRKLAAGFSAVVAIAAAIAAIAIIELRSVVAGWQQVMDVEADNVIQARKLEVTSLRRVSANRGYLLTRDEKFRQATEDERRLSGDLLKALVARASGRDEQDLLEKVRLASDAQAKAADDVMAARAKADATLEAVSRQFQDEVVPQNRAFQDAIESFTDLEWRKLEDGKRAADRAAWTATWLVAGIAAGGAAVAAGLAILLGRGLSRQIGSAVQHIRNSSGELQAAANQQTSGSKEQVASMTEISATIRELVSTAKQIAGSAGRVAHIAEDTAAAARAGGGVVDQAREDVSGIRRQVDSIVGHMLDLGRKSQQIGGILEIIDELAEQTNILAINATIEAAGAGEHGSRFGAVAEEIRNLADRVGGSTKEIRALIAEIRAAIDTTVMATEGGSKAVDVGIRQFGDVAGAFGRITDLVATTTEAAKEIELSTKQQTTAVEQVNIAVGSVVQAAKESEASSSQVLQTVSELTRLSRELTRLVRAEADGNGRA